MDELPPLPSFSISGPALPFGQASAPPAPPMAPPAPQAQGVDWQRLIGPLATIALAASGHPNAAIGAGRGSMLAEEQMRRQQELDRSYAVQQEQIAARQQQLAAQEEAKRQAAVQALQMKALELRASAKNKTDYDVGITMLENIGQQYGIRPNTLRAAAPYRAPNADEILAKASDAFLKNPANKEAIESGQLTGSMMVDIQGDGKPVPVPVVDVLKAGGVQFDPVTQKPVIVPKKANASGGVQLDDEAFLGAVARFEADKGRPATQAERGDIAQKVTEELAKKRKQGNASVIVQGGSGSSDIQAIADAIESGTQSPDTKGLYSKTAALRAELGRRGYDLKAAQLDWAATQRWITTANGPQQTRMRQAIDNAYHSLDVIEELAAKWKGGKFPMLNRGRLAAAKQGALGPEAQAIATQLDAQISDVTSELANVYMGGNSPTDHAMDLARKNLSADWTESQLLGALNLARKNLQIRQNSMTNTQAVTPSPKGPAPEPMGVEEWIRDPKTGKLVKAKGGG